MNPTTLANCHPQTQEHFAERAAMREFEGGMSAEEAENAAHLDTVTWLQREINRLEMLDIVTTRQIFLIEHSMRQRGLDPNAMYALPPDSDQ